MSTHIITMKEKPVWLRNLDDLACNWIERAKAIEPAVPGITDAIAREVDELRATIKGSKPHRFSVEAHAGSIHSRLEWAEQGLYSKVVGNAWHYAGETKTYHSTARPQHCLRNI